MFFTYEDVLKFCTYEDILKNILKIKISSCYGLPENDIVNLKIGCCLLQNLSLIKSETRQ